MNDSDEIIMVFVKNVKYCEAECGECIDNFAKELVNYRKNLFVM